MLGLGLVASAAAQRPEPNAFLNKPAHSTAELVRQIKSDPVVMDRFMRHFGMSKDEVVAMMSELRLAKMKKDTPMTVYNCNDQGVIGSKVFMIKAGALVYVDKYGNPVLKGTCANPFFGRIPFDVPEVETEPYLGPMRKSDDVEAIVEMPMSELVEPPFEPVPILPLPTPPRIEIPGTEDTFVESRRRSAPWGWLLLGGLFIDKDCCRPCPPPEKCVPGPAAALAFGGPAMAAMARRRRKKA